MYERHWRLTRPAFRSETPSDFFFPADSHQACLLKLRYLVEQRQGIAVFTGVSGTGKSFVLDTFREQLAAPIGPVISVLFPQMTPAELLGYLCSKLDDSQAPDMSGERMDHVLQRLESRLSELTQQHRHPIFIIDDAQLIEDRRVFQTLQLLLNYRQDSRMEFSIILAGQPELLGQIKRFGALFERLAFICTLHTLTEQETAEYVHHRITQAGGSTAIFHPEALQAIHQLSGGLPRRINRLCDFALLVGYADNLEQVTTEQVEAVAEELSLVAA